MSERWRTYTVVTVRRFRTDYVVMAADERDAWNRVDAVERGTEPEAMRVTVATPERQIGFERFAVYLGDERWTEPR